MKKCCSILLLSLFMSASFAQWPANNNLLTNQLFANPSFAGGSLKNRIETSYFSQWPRLDKSFSSNQLSYDTFLESLNSGVGVAFSSSKLGGNLGLNKTLASLNYAYLISTDNGTFHLGTAFSIQNLSINPDELLFPDQIINGSIQPTKEILTRMNVIQFDPSIGFSYSNKFSTLGISISNLLRNTTDLYSLTPSTKESYIIQLQSSYRIWELESSYYNKPPISTFDWLSSIYLQGKFIQFNTGVVSSYHPVYGGIFIIGFPFTKTTSGHNRFEALQGLIGYKDNLFTLSYHLSYYFNSINYEGLVHQINLNFRLIPFERKNNKWKSNKHFSIFEM